MAKQDAKLETVMGFTIKTPQLTRWAILRLAQYIILPFLGVLLLMDVLLYLVFKYELDSCYGVLCLID